MPEAKKVVVPSNGAETSHQQLLQQLKQIDASTEGGYKDDDIATSGRGTLLKRVAATCGKLHVSADI